MPRPALAAPGLRGYRAEWLRGDVPAGLAIAAVGLPSAIAYPAIAGLPPETGIYASIAPWSPTRVFGPSQKLIVGPDAATMTVLAAVLTPVVAAAPATADRVAMAAVLALAVGGALPAGAGAAARGARELPVAADPDRLLHRHLALDPRRPDRPLHRRLDRGGGPGRPLRRTRQKAGSIHWPSVALALAMFAVLQAVKARASRCRGRWSSWCWRRCSRPLFDFRGHGIAVVGDIPTRLPSFASRRPAGFPSTPSCSAPARSSRSASAPASSPPAASARGAAMRSTPTASSSASAPPTSPPGFFGAFPVTASDSRTAVNLSAGGRSQLAGVVAAAALVATLLFLGDVAAHPADPGARRHSGRGGARA